MTGFRYRIRAIETLLPSSSSRRIAIVTGARQTGKTTLLRHVYPDVDYLNLDAIEHRELVADVSTFNWGRTIGPAILDEAQKQPLVFDKLKFAFDEHGVDFSVLSGSSQILLLKQVRESLSGRAFIFELLPLMFCELVSPPGQPHVAPPLIDVLIRTGQPSCALEDVPERLRASDESACLDIERHLLHWGGMPELLQLEDAQKAQWLKSYEFTYLERDLSDLARLTDLEPFKKLQRLAAHRTSQLLSYAEIGRDAGISSDSARRYIEYLKLSYQVFLLSPYARNLTSRVIKTPKIYWIDMGILRILSGIGAECTGPLYENFIVTEVHKWLRTVSADAQLSFYRTRSGLEVDLLIQTSHGVLGIEIKARDRVSSHDVRSMRLVAESLGKEWLGGLCVYRGRSLHRLCDPDIWAVPGFRLLT